MRPTCGDKRRCAQCGGRWKTRDANGPRMGRDQSTLLARPLPSSFVCAHRCTLGLCVLAHATDTAHATPSNENDCAVSCVPCGETDSRNRNVCESHVTLVVAPRAPLLCHIWSRCAPHSNYISCDRSDLRLRGAARRRRRARLYSRNNLKLSDHCLHCPVQPTKKKLKHL
jgi:hypothetical protein